MPKYKAPSSDRSRQAFLETAVSVTQLDQANGIYHLSATTLAEMEALLPLFTAQIEAMPSLQVSLQRARARRKTAVNNLRTLLRDFWAAARRMIRRGELPSHALTYYGLSSNGRNPRLYQMQAAMSYAHMAITGDTNAVTAGFAPVTNPAASDLQIALTEAQARDMAVHAADRLYHTAQIDLANLRREVDKLIRKIAHELRFNLHDRPASSRRRIMRIYGVKFVPRPGEKVSPEEEMGLKTAVTLAQPAYNNGSNYQPADPDRILAPANGAHV